MKRYSNSNIASFLSASLLGMALAVMLVMANPAIAASEQVVTGRQQGIPAPAHIDLRHIPVCYGFSCRTQDSVTLSNDEWQDIKNWFHTTADNAEQEREQIKQAIGWMEVLIGRHTPTYRDVAFDLPPNDEITADLFPGQQDCIDEAFNTSVYLKLFEQQGLLKHHRVVEQAYRKSIFDQHWAGQIEELAGGKRYVVDSWFQPNGYVPVIQDSEKWHDISLLTAVVDDSRDPEQHEKKSFWKKLIGAN